MVRSTTLKRCCVKDCKTTNGLNITMHGFPSDAETKYLWIKKIFNAQSEGEVKIANNLFVCSRHFDQSCYRYVGGKKLKPTAVPNLFLKKHSVIRIISKPNLKNAENDMKPCKADSNLFSKQSDVSVISDIKEEKTGDDVNSQILQNNHMCNDKLLLLREIGLLKTKIEEIDENYNKLKERYEKVLIHNVHLQKQLEDQKKAQKYLQDLSKDSGDSNTILPDVKMEQI